jgi:predicted HD superfamily hydrolase involved in NAD metabolism
MDRVEEITAQLKKDLSPERFGHSISVAEDAEMLAELNGVEPRQAYIAGLLHDCAREWPANKMQEYIQQNRLSASEYELEFPLLLHCIIGADLVRKVYKIDDSEVMISVAKHTAGGAELSPLSKIVYVADFIEQGRTGDISEKVRQIAIKNLDDAVLAKAKYMLEYSQGIAEKTHPDVLATIKYYQKEEV